MITSSPPAWTSSTGVFLTPADFCFFNDCSAASTSLRMMEWLSSVSVCRQFCMEDPFPYTVFTLETSQSSSVWFCLQLYCLIGISPTGNSCRFPQGKPAVTVTLPNLQCILGDLAFPTSTEPNKDYRIFIAHTWTFCMRINMGPWFIVSSKGLLWGIESAQNFDTCETHP